MSVVIGIDVGGSTTKICGFSEENNEQNLISPIFVRATDPITSIYGAFGRFTDENDLSLKDISKVKMTGVGSSGVSKAIYDLPCEIVPEFRSTGLGGLYISGLSEAIVVSMGTGTALVYARRGHEPEYLGGTGVGGGTLVGLAKKMIGMEIMEHIEEVARKGDLSNVDLRIGDISRDTEILPHDMTASNFGKLSDIASKGDIALGIMNMVFETVGMLSLFAARSHGLRDVVLTGNLTSIEYSKEAFSHFGKMFDLNIVLPEMSQFATVIGTALCGLRDDDKR